MTARLSMRDAINAKCKDCIYDPVSRGTWREQVRECTSATCPLFPLRPLPIGARKAEDLPVSPQSQPDEHEPEPESDDGPQHIARAG
jgi:hypothetical protein